MSFAARAEPAPIDPAWGGGSRRALLCGIGAAGLLAASPHPRAGAAEQPALPRIDDQRALGRHARRERLPILLFFSTPGCPFCLEVRRNYLAPRVAQGSAAAGALIREVDIASRRELIGADGKATTEAALAERCGVRFVPVVVLVDHDVRPLGEPLVGFDRAGFYESRLAAAIESAHALVAAR